MKKRVNVMLSPAALATLDLLAKENDMNRSEYLNYLILIAEDRGYTRVSSVLADEASESIKKALK